MPLAIVTGASRGMGRDVALMLAEKGYTVACLARNEAELQSLAKHHDRIVPARVDLTKPEALDAVVKGIIEEHGPVSVLINNAGYGLRSAVEDIPLDRFRHQMELNVFACARMIQLVLPGMRAAKAGRIVNISSVAGRIATPYGGAYCATKFALEALTDALRLEVRPWGIGVVLVEPGPVATNFVSAAASVSETVAADDSSAYASQYAVLHSQLSKLHTGSWACERVAKLIVNAAVGPRAPARVKAFSPLLRLAIAVRNNVPGLFDTMIARRFGISSAP